MNEIKFHFNYWNWFRFSLILVFPNSFNAFYDPIYCYNPILFLIYTIPVLFSFLYSIWIPSYLLLTSPLLLFISVDSIFDRLYWTFYVLRGFCRFRFGSFASKLLLNFLNFWKILCNILFIYIFILSLLIINLFWGMFSCNSSLCLSLLTYLSISLKLSRNNYK